MIFDGDGQRVIKITLPGFYGRYARMKLSGIEMGPAKPLEYLDRLTLHNQLFEDDATVLGIVADKAGPRIAIAQPLVVGERPTTVQVVTFMAGLGFAPRLNASAFWREEDRVAVFDAHAGNFLRGPSGQIFVIDVIPIGADPLMASWMYDAED